MPYNPSLPADHAQVVSSELRAQFNALKALIDAQQTQIDPQAAQLAAQQIQIAALEAMFQQPAPAITSDQTSSADGAIAKSAVVAAPGAWEFITSFTTTIDPNQDLTNCISVGVLAGSDDGGAVWSKHCPGCWSGPFTAARYQIHNRWSPFSNWVFSET